MAEPLTVVCVNCGANHAMNAVERPLDCRGDIDVGIECPECHFFVHRFYLNPRLKDLQAKLANFKRLAHKSAKHWQRYKRKQAEYQREFDAFNQRAFEARQPAMIQRVTQTGMLPVIEQMLAAAARR